MRTRTTALKVLVSAVFVLAMAFGVSTMMPSGNAVQAAQAGSTICQVSADGLFSTTSGDAAVCADFEARYVSGGPCQIVISGAGVVIDQGNCVFSDATVTPVPTETTVTPVPTETTVTPVPTETTVTPVPTETTVTPVPTETTVTPVPSETATTTAVPSETAVVTVTTAPGQPTAVATTAPSNSTVNALPETGAGSTTNSTSNSAYVAFLSALALVATGGAVYAVRSRKN